METTHQRPKYGLTAWAKGAAIISAGGVAGMRGWDMPHCRAMNAATRPAHSHSQSPHILSMWLYL